MDDLFFKKLCEVMEQGRPFVLATVVRCDQPTSAKPGAKAIVCEDGAIIGWIGGSCAQPIVVNEAKQAIQDRQPKLLKIGADDASQFGQNEGVLNFEMTCFSGGTMEIFIEPVLPRPQLVLVGSSPDVQVLAQLGRLMNFQLVVMDPELDPATFPEETELLSDLDFGKVKKPDQTFVIIATHGRYDEEALEKSLTTQVPYIGLISSKKRAAAIFDYLKKKGISEKQWQRVKAPAGLDIGARTPDEIALSIMAEIVEFRQRKLTVSAETTVEQSAEEALDPICGMTVEISKARYKTTFAGSAYYFCGAGCLQKFEEEPEKFAQPKLT